MSLSSDDKRTLWVKAGGRCTLCKRYLLEGDLSGIEVPLGEGAHIVGQQLSARSPRGLDPLPVDERDTPANVMLACAACHNEIDKAKVAKVITTEMLLARKSAHEAEIRHQTGLTGDRRTAVLRMYGTIRGAMMNVDAIDASRAVLKSSDRFPLFPSSYNAQGFELDLRTLPGEDRPAEGYYSTAVDSINYFVNNRLAEGVARGHVSHLSVFAIARLPLLVHLGAMLDDGISTDVYQRHRHSGEWVWPEYGSTREFKVLSEGSDQTSDAVLMMNLSGAPSAADVPATLVGCRTYKLHPTSDVGHEDIIGSPETLAAFRSTVRIFFSMLESEAPQVSDLHVFGALPVSAAVSLGQCLKARDLRPRVVLYDLTANGYEFALEL